MTHTPGPWLADSGSIVSVTRMIIADCFSAIYRNSPPMSDEVMVANARLIAAAPDMLAALKALVVHDEADDSRRGLPPCMELVDAHAAIAKAEGVK